MATAIIGAMIDYCNGLMYGTAERNINRLQKAQNATARTVHQASWCAFPVRTYQETVVLLTARGHQLFYVCEVLGV